MTSDRPVSHWSFATCHLKLLLHHILHRWLEIRHGAAQAGKVNIVGLGNLNPVSLAQLHNDVKKIHAVEFELLAEWLIGDKAGKVFVGRDVGQDIEDFLADFGGGHVRLSSAKTS